MKAEVVAKFAVWMLIIAFIIYCIPIIGIMAFIAYHPVESPIIAMNI